MASARPRKPAGTRPAFRPQPEGTVRRSQVVRTYGPGAMIDLVDHAVMIGGLDFWRYRAGDVPKVSISEPRLRDRLAPQFQQANRPLATTNCFRLPPPGDDKDVTEFSGIEVLELPRWFVCQSPSCRALVRADGLELRGKRYRHGCIRAGGSETVPVRFVATCQRGHVEELLTLTRSRRNLDHLVGKAGAQVPEVVGVGRVEA